METRPLLAVLVVVFGPLALVPCAALQTCPRGWVASGDSCYHFHQGVKYDWVKATHFCLIHGSYLASIETAAEDKFIQQHLRSTYNDEYENSFWLAATDDVSEGNWKWIPNNAPLAYLDWGPGQPDNANDNHHEDCLALRGDANFQWHDAPCEDLYYPICEMMSPTFDLIG